MENNMKNNEEYKNDIKEIFEILDDIKKNIARLEKNINSEKREELMFNTFLSQYDNKIDYIPPTHGYNPYRAYKCSDDPMYYDVYTMTDKGDTLKVPSENLCFYGCQAF